MSHAAGKTLGGIRTVEDLRQRCRIDEETGCWVWSMAARKYEGKREPETAVWLAEPRKAVNGKKAAALLSGRTFRKGQLAYGTCCNWQCVNPDHVKVGTPKQRGAFVASRGHLKGCPTRAVKNKQAGRVRSRVTMELAEWIRESPQTGRDVACTMGLAESVISRIRRGQSWTASPKLAAASVFSWQPTQVRVSRQHDDSGEYERAARAGLRFFEGVPCEKGHTQRYVVDRACVVCQRAKAMRKWQADKEAA